MDTVGEFPEKEQLEIGYIVYRHPNEGRHLAEFRHHSSEEVAVAEAERLGKLAGGTYYVMKPIKRITTETMVYVTTLEEL